MQKIQKSHKGIERWLDLGSSEFRYRRPMPRTEDLDSLTENTGIAVVCAERKVNLSALAIQAYNI